MTQLKTAPPLAGVLVATNAVPATIDVLSGILALFDDLMELERFNVHLENDHVRFYVRAGYHAINGSVERTIDIADVVIQSHAEGQGLLRRFVEHVERTVAVRRPGHYVYLENVLNEDIRPAIERWGYKMTLRETNGITDNMPCYWKLPTP